MGPFFRCAPVGYSATAKQHVFDGVELGTCGWGMKAVTVDRASSTWFEDATTFPPGSATLDSAFVMSRIETTWVPRPKLRTSGMQLGALPSPLPSAPAPK
ncbi:MAG: hypothetical protein ACLGI2_07685 [Acidimicrobiia bacterium]